MSFDDYVNAFCREFREKRDYLLEQTEDDIKKEIDRFWNRQPWYIRVLRKQVMRGVYRGLKELF